MRSLTWRFLTSMTLICGLYFLFVGSAVFTTHSATSSGAGTELCGTSCGTKGIGGSCDITCPAGMNAQCTPGRSYYEGNSLIIVPPSCDCIGRRTPPEKGVKQCGGSCSAAGAGSSCSITCGEGVVARCTPGTWKYEGLSLVMIPASCKC